LPPAPLSSIDETDDGGIGKIIDDVEAAVILMKAKQVLKRESESVTEDDPVNRPVTDNQKIPAFVAFQNSPETSHHPFGQLGKGLPISRGPKTRRISHAILEECRESLANLLQAESFPVTEVELPELRAGMDGHIMILSDDAGSQHRSL
jgi:hypothetical protein